MLRLDAGGSSRALVEAQKFANLVAEFGQRLVIVHIQIGGACHAETPIASFYEVFNPQS
jgi:hypothetical protein